MKWCVLVLVFAGLTRGDNAIDTNNIFNCPDLNAQDEIDLDKRHEVVYVYILVLQSDHTIVMDEPHNGSQLGSA
ncbi:hypothetical protein ALC53_01989 [Atta colombica]|uniref:Uncharacterized protein n=1 Tax=Atta colombica TaxID=520822 RepID=A0A195BRL3_9HYME|nr:hypothetical protein ALC53_01989 [Atta colombica]